MTHEVRVDPLSGLRTIVAGGRAGRPGALAQIGPPPPVDAAGDPFAEGHEHRTPPELLAVGRPDGAPADTPGWKVRVVPNRWPVLDGDTPEPEPRAARELLSAAPARGAHEVIVSAPRPVVSLGDLDVAELELLLDVWRARMREHSDAACVHLWVNEGPDGGSSLAHSHAQLLALDAVPAQIARERERFTAHAQRTMGGDLLADLVQEEVKLRERLVAHDDDAVLLSPFAARVPFALMLAPRSGRARFEDDGPSGARLLHGALQRLRAVLGAIPPLNLWVRTAPRGAEHFCWRIDVLPRLTPVAGLELGTGLAVTVVSPEDAAVRLRAAG